MPAKPPVSGKPKLNTAARKPRKRRTLKRSAASRPLLRHAKSRGHSMWEPALGGMTTSVVRIPTKRDQISNSKRH